MPLSLNTSLRLPKAKTLSLSFDDALIFRLLLSAATALSLYLAFLLVLAMMHSRAVFDDFGLIRMSHIAPLGVLHSTYANLTGRYAFVLLFTQTSQVGGTHLGFVLGGILALWLSLWMLAFGRRGAYLQALGAWCALLVSCASLIPHPYQALCWYAATTNLLPAFVLCPLVLLVRRMSSVWGAFLGTVLGFAMSGFQEQATLVLFVGVGALFVRDSLHKHLRAGTSGVLVGMIIGTVVLLGAPGNVARAAREAVTQTKRLTPTQALSVGFGEGCALCVDATPHLGVVFPSLLDLPRVSILWGAPSLLWLAVFAALWGQQVRPRQKVDWKRTIGIVVGGFSLCTLVMVATVLASKQAPETAERVLFVPVVVLSAMWALLGYEMRALLRPNRWFLGVMGLSLYLSVAMVGKVQKFERDMTEYSAKWDVQDKKLRALAKSGAHDVQLESLSTEIVAQMWMSDKNHWVNQEVAHYYGLRSIAEPK